jgi:hypothetical protein
VNKALLEQEVYMANKVLLEQEVKMASKESKVKMA